MKLLLIYTALQTQLLSNLDVHSSLGPFEAKSGKRPSTVEVFAGNVDVSALNNIMDLNSDGNITLN